MAVFSVTVEMKRFACYFLQWKCFSDLTHTFMMFQILI